MDAKPSPFLVEVPEADLEDLRARLDRTRWPADSGSSGDWSRGTNKTFLRGLLEHWRSGFDWRRQEAALNRLPQFRLQLEKDDLHFVHERGTGLPILLLNGWPSSPWEFSRLIPILTAAGFSVVAPSLPGFTFSFAPGRRPDMIESADAMAELMTALGYERFGVVGGDTGATLMSRLAFAHPERIAGVFFTSMSLGVGACGGDDEDPEVRRYQVELAEWERDQAGYFAIQGSRPRTLAYGLADSPAGLAAWLVDKMIGWSDRSGAAENLFSADDLLTNVSLYWFTGCIGSSFWPYWARLHGGWTADQLLARGERLVPPAGYSLSRADVNNPRVPRVLAERLLNLHHFVEMPAGGHFPAFEVPSALGAELIAFFERLD